MTKGYTNLQKFLLYFFSGYLFKKNTIVDCIEITSTVRLLRIIILIMFFVVLTACIEQDRNVNTVPSGSESGEASGMQIPSALQARPLPTPSALRADLYVDNEADPRPMTINGTQVELTVSGLSIGQHSFIIEFKYYSDTYGTEVIVSRSNEKTIQINQGDNNLGFTDSDYDISMDDDEDLVTNLDESFDNSNPRIGDTDSDGLRDDIDKCRLVAGSDQTDLDDDGYGDWCQEMLISSVWPRVIPAGADVEEVEITVSGDYLQNASATINGLSVTPNTQTKHSLSFVAPAQTEGAHQLVITKNHVSDQNESLDYFDPVTASSVASGVSHSCAVSDGVVLCWGSNTYGQLGDGTTTDSTKAVIVVGISTAYSVSVGSNHSCARLSDNSVMCWGYNGSFQSGGSTFANVLTPNSISIPGNVMEISSGGGTNCALIDNGSVECWGANNLGQLGDGSQDSSRSSVTVTGITTAQSVSVGWGSGFACALLTDNTIRCWGSNWDGQLGDGNGGPNTMSLVPVTVNGITTAASIATGGYHSCAILADATIRCWGGGLAGQLGNGAEANSATPVVVSGINTAQSISLNGHNSCAKLSDNSLRCWGRNWYGQLGTTSHVYSTSPVDAYSGTPGVQSFSTGDTYTCIILTNNQLRCFGENANAQLGHVTIPSVNKPATVKNITNAVALTAGKRHSCVLLENGMVDCWGYNSRGQAGVGFQDLLSYIPRAVSGISMASTLLTGWYHNCAILQLGNIKCWGGNWAGQIGDNSINDALTPVSVFGISTAQTISGGYDFSCASWTDGTVQCWGANEDGQLGDGSNIDSLTPVDVVGITTAQSVSSGGGNACAVMDDQTVQCWGQNIYGQLGNNSSSNSNIPVAVNGINTALSVSLGDWHGCVLLDNSSVQCWGRNHYGQLGDNTIIDSLVPVSVTDLTNVISITLGDSHTCALIDDGTVQCWGRNHYGQLGSANNTDSPVPVVVFGIHSAVSIDAGEHHTCALLIDGEVQCWGTNEFSQVGRAVPFTPRSVLN